MQHNHTAPGLWITPIRGRVAVSALAWVVAYGLGVVVVTIGFLVMLRVAGGHPPGAAAVTVWVIVATALASMVAVRVHLVARHRLSWSDVGIRRPDRSPLHLLWQIPAVLATAVVVSTLVLVPFVNEQNNDDDLVAELISGGSLLAVLGFLAVAVLVPVAEEVVFRGIVLPALRARFQAFTGIALAGTLFAVVHLIPPALPYLVVVGVSLCVMAQWYRSIIPGIVLHGVNNAIVFASILTTT